MKYFITLLLAISLLSCNSTNADYNKLILGGWQLVLENLKNADVEFAFQPIKKEIAFKENNVFINKEGFYKENERKESETFEKISKRYFLGTDSKYKITKDSLFLYDLVSEKYFKYQILKLDEKDLILKNSSGRIEKYRKIKSSNKVLDTLFDYIIISDGPCFGTCPIREVSISKEGKIIYNGKNFNSLNGLYEGTFDKTKFENFRNRLNMLRIDTLKTDYGFYDTTDLQTTFITIIKDGKIYKSISDYGGASQRELQRIMNEIGYIYQTAQLQKTKFNTIEIFSSFTNENQLVDLMPSESFYLQTELLKAKKSEAKFSPTFFGKGRLEIPENFDYYYINTLERRIETDGRFFSIENKNKNFETFDLGYNFFEKNNLIKNKKP